MSTPYHYTPLDEKAQEIRLLTLLPGPFPARIDTKIRISLKIVQLIRDNSPEFEALSYAWGSTENALEILIETESGPHFLIVTQNLYDALQHLRHESQPRVFWIDAICIDQQNMSERSSQVRRMADVYTLSKRVVVWLGGEADDSSLALDCIEALGAKIEYDWERGRINVTSRDPSDKDLADKNEPLRYDRRELTAIIRLYERSWFERLWIWQEIWLADLSSILVCGKRTLLWATFRKAFACIYMKPIRNAIRPSSEYYNLIYNLCRQTGYRSFPTLLRLTQWAKCSDPRDRIFAVQSLLSPNDPVLGVHPNYEKEVSEVFIEVFLAYSNEVKRLSLMSMCDLALQAVGLPTWFPNWTTPQLRMSIANAFASGSSAAIFELKENNGFRVCGRTVETIESVAHHNLSFSNDVAPGDDGHFGTTIHKIACQFRVSGDQLESFCHALVAGFFDHHTYPQSKAPAFASSLVPAMELISKIIETPNINTYDLSASEKLYILQAMNMLLNRSVYNTKGGTFGLAPNCTEPGDIVVALFGLNTALILRRTDGNT
ncbi:HET-domain-containing protein [Stipitochalara longipes BDJ]|nr:HET-domain-containing protein [Stipitochalara longipes BDJ]